MGPRILGPDRGPLEPGGPRIGMAPAIILKTIPTHKFSTKKYWKKKYKYYFKAKQAVHSKNQICSSFLMLYVKLHNDHKLKLMN